MNNLFSKPLLLATCFALLTTIIAVGCGFQKNTGGQSGGSVNQSGGQASYTIGTHSIEVDGCALDGASVNSITSTSSGYPGNSDGAKASIICGSTKIEVTESSLKVDGKDYGPLKQNDAIVVSSGKVSVNDTPRSPTK